MAQRSLEEARAAYQQQDLTMTIKAHEAEHGHKENHKSGGDIIKSAIYGGFDGIITIFAIVAGAHGSNLGAAVVIILGISGAVGDGLSMGLGDYLSTKSEKEFNAMERKREEWEVENHPEGEIKEMIDIYYEKGIPLEDATTITNILSKHKEAWVDIMMIEELGIIEGDDSPIKNGMVTFGSFLLFGLIPLSPYLVGAIFKLDDQDDILFIISLVFTGLALFLMGILKARFTGGGWAKNAGEMVLVGAVAAGAAWLLGWLLGPLADNMK